MRPQTDHTDRPARRMSPRRRARLARTGSALLTGVVVVAVLTHGATPERVAASAPITPLPAPSTTPSVDAGAIASTEQARRAPRLFARPSVRHYLAAHAGHVTAAVFDHRTGRLYVYRPHVEMITASIVKVDILETLLARAQTLGGHLGVYEGYLCTRMIEESDNGAAQALWEILEDGEYVRRFNADAGIVSTRPDGEHWGLTTTTALDQVRLLRLIGYPNHTLTRESRTYAAGLMTHVDPAQAWGVSAGVPPRAVVALKNGWLPVTTGWEVNSVGLVHGRGRSYAIAVLVDDEPTMEAGVEMIEGLSRLVWKQLEPAPRLQHGHREPTVG